MAAAAGRLRRGARVPTVHPMRGTFRIALGALALAALATIPGRTSAQTNDSAPANTPPITLPGPTIPGQSTPQPTIPTTPQVAGTTSFLDGGSLLGGIGGSGFSAPGAPTYVMPDTSAYDAGSFSPGIGGAGTYGFSPDGGAF